MAAADRPYPYDGARRPKPFPQEQTMRKIFAQVIQDSAPEAPVVEPTAAPSFLVRASTPAMEALIDKLVEQLPEATIEREENFEVALESMQQDQAVEKKVKEENYQDLLKMMNPVAQTGLVQVFLLDESSMVAGHAGSHAALRAVVRASLSDSTKVVAALSSSWSTTEQVVPQDPEVNSQRAVLKDYLSAAKIPTVESFDELVQHLQSL